jgi:hypothetical protein
MSRPRKLFLVVPDNSTLEVCVSSDKPFYEASADGEALCNGENERRYTWRWTRPQLVKCQTKRLRKECKYTILIDFAFTGERTTATVRATIERPDGSVHSRPWVSEVTGKKGDVDSRVISIRMKKD